MDDSGEWFGRALGIWMVAITLSPWTIGMDKSALARLYLVPNVLFMGMFLYAAVGLETTGPGKNAMLPINLWYTQLPIAALFLFLNITAVGETSPKKD